MKRLRSSRPQTLDRDGTALVETALVLPIFFMVVLGIIEFGRAMMVAQLLNNGAREGTRVAIMPGSTNTDVQNAVLNFVTGAVGVAPEKVNVAITVTPATGNPDPGNNVALANKRDLCTVDVRVAFSDVDYLPGKFLNDRQLIGQSAMRHE
jgi:Flp pilus assembly protein TadG